MSDRTRWNERYRSGYGANEPNPRLSRYLGFLRRGLALDLGGGLGQNARLLNGWTTIVADVSDEALARASGLLVLVESPALPFAPETFDTIVCTYFLDPKVDFGSLLKPGGTLFFETFTRAHAKYRPEMSPTYLLDPSAVSTFFRDLKTVLWEEQDDGTRVYGTFIGVK